MTLVSASASLLDDVPIGLYRTAPDGRILDCNRIFAEMLHYPDRETLLAHNAADLYPTLSTRRRWQADLEYHTGMYQVEKQLRRYDGELIWVRDTARAVRGTHNEVLHYDGYLEDITVVRQRELEVKAIGRLSAALRTINTRPEMLATLVEQVRDLFNADGTSLTLANHAAAHTLVIEAGSGSGTAFVGQALPLGAGITGHVIATGEAYLTNQAASDPLLLWPHLLGEVTAIVCVPLKANQTVIGVVWVGRATHFTPPELHALTTIADLAANAIMRLSAHEALERNLQRLKGLRAIDMAIAGNMDLARTLELVLKQAQAQLGLEAAAILRWWPDEKELRYVVGQGFPFDQVKKMRLRFGEGAAGQAAAKRALTHFSIATAAAHPSLHIFAAAGFTEYYALPLIVNDQVTGVLEFCQHAPIPPHPDWHEFLETLAGQAAIAIDHAGLLERLVQSNLELTLAYDATIEGWSHALDLRDKETEGHSVRVMELAVRLARAMDMPPDELVHLYRGALLHDIGKMGVPDQILHKPGQLTPEEMAVMRQHPRLAYEMLAPITYLRRALDIPYCHHEKWDGTGYPRGLQGEAIPLTARIFAVADVWDAMTSDRPYRPACSEREVLDYIRAQSGLHFDPKVVAALLRIKGEALEA